MSNSLDSAAIEILQQGDYTTLALIDGNEPYILTLYYGFNREEMTVFYCTEKRGMKLDYLRSNPYTCGTIILKGCDNNAFLYRSLVYKGILEVIHDTKEQAKALKAIEKHSGFDIELSRLRDPMLMKLIMEESSVREWESNRPGS